MALKRKISKTEHAALAELLQKEYKADGEEFVLDAEGFDDPAELKRAKDREAQNAKDQKARADKAESDLQALREGTARSSGDIATLEKSWKEKNEKLEKDHRAELAKRDGHLQATLIDAVAVKLATDIAGPNADILLPHIKVRLTSDLTGEAPLTRVLDKDGKPSASSVEDLKKEISSDARFKAIVVASNASGGGAAGNGRPTNGGAASGAGQKFHELNDAERVDFYKRDPQGFETASKASAQEHTERRSLAF